MEYTYSRLKRNAYCAVVSKHDLSADLKSVGFSFIGMASIPPQGFQLPLSKKNRHGQNAKSNGSSDCIVSICKKI